MLNKMPLILLLVFVLNLFSIGEIIKISKLKQIEMKKFVLKRDIFSPRSTSFIKKNIKKIEKKSRQEKEIQKKEELRAEVSSSIVFEGLLLKNEKIFAMITISGEFFIVTKGTELLNRIMIKKIDRKNILIEIESKDILIERKGVSDE